MATETIYLRVDPKLEKRLRRLADRMGLTLTALCIQFLDDGCDREMTARGLL